MSDNANEPSERQRLDFLTSLNILDTEREDVFDRIVQFCARVCGTPTAIISLIDEGRQWIKASIGFPFPETERSVAFCDHTIRSREPFIVADATRDPLFQENPFVTGTPHLRFYAGFPLIFPQGFALGSLAIMDVVPRTLDETQIAFLKVLSQQIVALLELRRQREELQEQAAHLKAAQRIAKIGSWEMEPVSGRLKGSEELEAILGRTGSGGLKSFGELLASVHPADRERLADAVMNAVDTRTSFAMAHRIVQANGEMRRVRSHGSLYERPRVAPVLEAILQDVTEEYFVDERLRLLDAGISRISDTVMITEAGQIDEPGPRIVFANQAFEKLTGYRVEEMLGKSPRLLQGPKTSRTQLDRIRHALQVGVPVTAELINYRKDGAAFWLEISISPVLNENGALTHFVSVQRDITQRKETEAEIERLAFFDHLTGLPNRRLLLNRLQHEIENVRRSGTHGALMFIDLDNFKALNDTLGHDKGDMLLQQVARRLERAVRHSNTVARIGGDEFVVMLEDLGRDADRAASCAKRVAEKVLTLFEHGFCLAGREYYCTPSIGVTLFDQRLSDLTDLFKRADMAMYQAKTAGRNAVRFFDPHTQAVIDARSRLERELRAALAQRQFDLHYQPQVDMQGRTIGAEALLRWHNPRRGLVRPQAFIAMVEESGLINQIGDWVLKQACERLSSWAKDARTAHLSLSVNISPVQFRHPQFTETVLSALQAAQANPGRLKLEVTESVMIERVEEGIQKMKQLKDLGVRFSLDDFGTGYSSLSYLRRLPLDQLKIDRSFIADVLENGNDAAITRTIIALGQALNLDVIAEGVETRDQRDFLEATGCRSYQGYFFSRPLSSAQFASVVSRS